MNSHNRHDALEMDADSPLTKVLPLGTSICISTTARAHQNSSPTAPSGGLLPMNRHDYTPTNRPLEKKTNLETGMKAEAEATMAARTRADLYMVVV